MAFDELPLRTGPHECKVAASRSFPDLKRYASLPISDNLYAPEFFRSTQPNLEEQADALKKAKKRRKKLKARAKDGSKKAKKLLRAFKKAKKLNRQKRREGIYKRDRREGEEKRAQREAEARAKSPIQVIDGVEIDLRPRNMGAKRDKKFTAAALPAREKGKAPGIQTTVEERRQARLGEDQRVISEEFPHADQELKGVGAARLVRKAFKPERRRREKAERKEWGGSKPHAPRR